MIKPTPSRQDWALLFSTACYKFCIVAFYMIAIMTVLKTQGVDLSQLSWVYLLGILETLKFIVSPLIERFRLGKIGHFKGWFLSALIAMLGCFIALGFISPTTQLPLLLVICVLLNLASLGFGCAALGFACAILPDKQRGNGGVIQVIAGRIGKMIGGSLVLIIYQHYGWQSAVGFMAVLTILLMVQVAFYQETISQIASQTNYRLGFLFHRFFAFWQQTHISKGWFFLLFCFCIPSSMVVSLFVPSLSEQGWSPPQIGLLLSTIEPILVMIFTPLSGWLLKKTAPFKLIQTILFVQIFLFGLFYPMPQLTAIAPWLAAIPILLLSISYGLLMPCVLAILMGKSDPKLATLDSSLQFSVVLLGAYLAGFLALRAAQSLGYSTVYLAATLCAAGLWYLVKTMRTRLHA